MTADAALLLLVDARLPTGGHAHSGGLEEVVARGDVRDPRTLAAWLEGRLATASTLDAALAAAACAGPHASARWRDLDAEWAARTAAPALRQAGRAQGRGLLRAARAAWPSPVMDDLARTLPAGPPWAVALGTAAAALGAGTLDAATAAAFGSLSAPAWAATRLLGLDPFAVTAALGSLGPALDAVAAAASRSARRPLAALPAPSAPLSDIGAQRHAAWEVRLFAS